MLKRLASLLLISIVAACGGGGGDAGTSPFGTGAGGGGGATTTGGTTTTPGTTAAYVMAVDLQRVGVSTAQMSSTETIQAIATVTSAGAPVEGAVVSFSQEPGTLLSFAPSAATALSDANGKATIDVKAADPANIGATAVKASATIATVSVTGSKTVQITAGAFTGGVLPTPAAITFVSSTPSGTAIVIKGTGGSGRSESAVLLFRVVDAGNAPVNAVSVGFALNGSNGGATLQQVSGVSNSDGLVGVTVSSGTSPATIVVTATVAGTAVSTQSDSLIVSNSLPVAGGFEIVAAKYNLDGRTTGDSTTITAYVRDQFGNPVPDGVAVNFTTDYGAVASSTLGGCTTSNGVCTVGFRVQDPRPVSDGIATVTATVRVGSNTQLIQTLQINMAGASGTPYLALGPLTSPTQLPQSAATATQLQLASCKEAFELYLSDGSGHAPASGTTIVSAFSSTNVAIAIKSGTPVLDQLQAGSPPVLFDIEVDVSAASLLPLCNPAGTIKTSGFFFRLQYKTPGGVVYSQRIDLSYPQ